ncbi:hypothetical protein SDC9_177121 [bioreactor metagenome]|uniref:Uncharacterized protein n=1 Tax=bioreactor metagenome TaxID=1076179 RepID=A0A645GS27_9ZZZZ
MRISHPVNRTDMIERTFLQYYVNIYCFFIMFVNCVTNNLRIAVSKFMIFADKIIFILLIKTFNELFRAEKVNELSLLVSFLHRPFQFTF